jgi:hypothetical protein
MKFYLVLIVLLSLLIIPAALGQEINVDQLKEKSTQSADNVTTYTYSRTSESEIDYSNDTFEEALDLEKNTEGKVNLTAQTGWWSHNLTDEENGDVLTWQGYYLNNSEYWKEGQNWTKFNLTDPKAVMDNYNELPSQVGLISYSDMKLAGTENIDGIECYKLAGTPLSPIEKTILGVQLFASYLGSPINLPDDLENKSFSFDKTKLLDNSNVTITAWISKDTYLLKRIEIDSDLTITPSILNIEEPNFKIVSTLHEVTNYENYGASVQITLPSDAENLSYRTEGADWRWAVFGLLEP